MSLPRKEKPLKEAQATEEHTPVETAEERPTEEKRPVKKRAKGEKKANEAKN